MDGTPFITAIIPVMAAETALPRLLAEVKRAGLRRILLVANGTPQANDAALLLGRRFGARVITHPGPVGHDVCRALGAAALQGGAALFLDADLPLTADQMTPFAIAVASGVDLALNRIDPFVSAHARSHPVNVAKRFLNVALGRADLGYASMTAVPHALSEGALRTIGSAPLAVPPRAQAMAAEAGLRIEAIHPVDVVRTNPTRPGLNTGKENPVQQLIIGDHLEAVDWFLRECGDARGRFTDLWRKRELVRP